MTASSQMPSLNRRSFLLRTAQLTGAVVGAGALLDACGIGGSSTSTLTIMAEPGEITPAILDAFTKANPSIKITFIKADPLRLNAMYAAGTPPDFVRVNGVPDMPNVNARGLALNLDPYFAKSSVLKSNDLQAVNDVFRWDGKQEGQGSRYGMCQDWSPDTCFWYNKKVFDAAGVSYPSATEPLTYDELLDLGKRLTVRQNGKIQVYGLDCDWNIHYFNQGQILQMMAQQGAKLWSDDFSQVNFTSPEARKVIQWYVDWAQAHVGPSILDPDANGPFQLFPANRTGILMFGYWFGRTIATDTTGLADHVGFAPAPVFGSTRVSASLSATGAYIPKDAKNPDAAWKFFEYFFGGQPAVDRAKIGSGVPSLKSLFNDLPQTQPYQQQAYQTNQNEVQYAQILRFSPYVSYAAMENALAQYVEPIMQGKTSLDDGVQQLQNAVTLLIQQGKSQVGA